MAKSWIGTSGWHYAHWVGPFYPPGTGADDYLPYYAARFETVEINTSFYRLPKPDVLAAWRALTPDGFLFAAKASRYITHMKKLKDPGASTQRFFAAMATLGPKLGPILFQLPPRWRANPDRLARFLEALPAEHRYAFEFRDRTWFDDRVYEILRRHRAACCAYEIGGCESPLIETAAFDYLRLHGPGEAYRGRYSDRALDAWADRLGARLAAGRDVYCYFDNDEAGFAAGDAARLRARLAGAAG